MKFTEKVTVSARRALAKVITVLEKSLSLSHGLGACLVVGGVGGVGVNGVVAILKISLQDRFHI